MVFEKSVNPVVSSSYWLVVQMFLDESLSNEALEGLVEILDTSFSFAELKKDQDESGNTFYLLLLTKRYEVCDLAVDELLILLFLPCFARFLLTTKNDHEVPAGNIEKKWHTKLLFILNYTHGCFQNSAERAADLTWFDF